MTSGVYAIVNTATGRAYVGSSRQIEIRWADWRSKLDRGTAGSKALQADWNVSQGQDFSFTVLEETTTQDEAMEEAERRWIERYDGRCYNIHKQAGRPAIGSALTRLSSVRIAAGLSVAALAKKADVSTTAIYNAERGRMTHGATAGRLADALGVDTLKLFSAEQEAEFWAGQARLEARMRQRRIYFAALARSEQQPRRRSRRQRAQAEGGEG